MDKICNNCKYYLFKRFIIAQGKFCMHKDNLKVKVDPSDGSRTALIKNMYIEKRWNKKLKCRRFEEKSKQDYK